MADIKTRIRSTLQLVREAIRAVDADPEFREAIERVEKADDGPLALPADRPEVILGQIERTLSRALERLDGQPPFS